MKTSTNTAAKGVRNPHPIQDRRFEAVRRRDARGGASVGGALCVMCASRASDSGFPAKECRRRRGGERRETGGTRSRCLRKHLGSLAYCTTGTHGSNGKKEPPVRGCSAEQCSDVRPAWSERWWSFAPRTRAATPAARLRPI